jgi:tetratricopeptide (TPR) repeat protein
LSPTLELEIQQLMVTVGKAEVVINDLVNRFDQFTQPEEIFTICQFFINSGQIQKFISVCLRQVEKNDYIPWTLVMEVAGLNKLSLNNEIVIELLRAYQKTDPKFDTLLSFQLDHWSEEFVKVREAANISWENRHIEKKKDLKDQLQFLKAQRIDEEEAKVLEKFENMFPDDTDIKRQRQDLVERKARDVLSKSSGRDVVDEPVEQKLGVDEQKFKKLLTEACFEKISKNPNHAYDLSLLLYFMGFYDTSLEMIRLSPPTTAADWFRLELLLMARRYVEALTETSQLELKYAQFPEATIAALYSRARAMWGLHRSDEAIELLKRLIDIRPNYLSANSLLQEWAGHQR